MSMWIEVTSKKTQNNIVLAQPANSSKARITDLSALDLKTCDPLDLQRRPADYQVMGLRAGGDGVIVVG